MKPLFPQNNRLIWISSTVLVLVIYQFCYGLETIIPTNISWLLTIKHDWGGYYTSWDYYRNEPCHFPLGRIDSYFYPGGTNIGLTDGIPLFAIPFKLLGPLLPTDFQYFGLFLLLSHLLTAWFSVLLLRRFRVKDSFILLAVALIAANPVLIYRGMHIALCAQWVILACLYIYVHDPLLNPPKKLLRYQFILLLVSALINPYICLFVTGFSFFTSLKLVQFDKVISIKYGLVYLAVSGIALFALWYLVGMFNPANQQGLAVQSSYGLYSMNLNALYNAQGFSTYIPAQKQVSLHQYEGFMYLGLGMMVLLLFLGFYLLYERVIRPVHNHQTSWKNFQGISLVPLYIFAVLVTVFALTHIISLNDKVLFTYPLPDFIRKAGDVFRASGRFFWLPYYLLFIVAFVMLWRARLGLYVKILVLAVVLLIQFSDTKRMFTYRHLSYGSYRIPLDTNSWMRLIRAFDRVEMFPPFQTTNLDHMDYQYFSYLSTRALKPINTGYVSRGENTKTTRDYANSFMDALDDGRLSAHSLYITTWQHLNRFSMAIQSGAARLNYLDGYYFLYSDSVTNPDILRLSQQLGTLHKGKLDSVLNAMGQAQFEEIAAIKPSTEKIRFAIDRFSDRSKTISLKGFAFVEQTDNNQGDSIFFTLVSDKKFYIAGTNHINRPDVTAYFKKSYLDAAGFEATVSKKNLDKGKYSIGLVIKTRNGNLIYQPTEQVVKVDLDDYPTISRVDSLPGKSPVRASIEKMESRQDIFYFSGWAFLEHSLAEQVDIRLVFRNETGDYLVDTEPVLRKDVTDYFKSAKSLDNSGFEVRVLKKSLPKGKYRVGLFLSQPKTGEKGLFFPEQQIENN